MNGMSGNGIWKTGMTLLKLKGSIHWLNFPCFHSLYNQNLNPWNRLKIIV